MRWMEEAACIGEDPTYFEYEPTREELEDAVARTELAQEVCHLCLVQRECRDGASGSDRLWTVRGGLAPIALTRRLRGA